MYLCLESVLHLYVTEKGKAEEAGQESQPEADVPLPEDRVDIPVVEQDQAGFAGQESQLETGVPYLGMV